jgi:hypothetical protein
LIATPTARPCRVTSISAKMNGWTAMTSLSIFRAVSITSRYSANVAWLFSTITCALTPSTLSRNCFWNPLVTASTIVSAATPSATPRIDTLVNTLNTDSSVNTAVAMSPSTNMSTPAELPLEPRSRSEPMSVTSEPPPPIASINGSRLPP